jgi:hypothetical protein
MHDDAAHRLDAGGQPQPVGHAKLKFIGLRGWRVSDFKTAARREAAGRERSRRQRNAQEDHELSHAWMVERKSLERKLKSAPATRLLSIAAFGPRKPA